MDLFEVVTITLSVVLGLSMSHMLWSAAAAVRARKALRLHWLPFAWAGCIFLQHAHFWFAILSIDSSLGSWTWSWFLHVLLLAVLLFGAGALVFPSESERTGDLLHDYELHGRLALVPFALYQLLWLPTNYRAGGSSDLGDLFDPGNVANYALIALLVVGVRSKKIVTQKVAVVLFAIILIWAQSVIWSPGVFQAS